MWTLLVVFLLAISHIHGQSVVTNGTSGEPCPHRRCLAGRADCIDGTCVCRAPFVLRPENGKFACHRRNNVDAEVKNDPAIKNFNDETADFPYPCRYLVTSTQTALRIQKQRVGTCRCMMHAFNNKYRGKFYVGGFDFTCRINNTARNEEMEFAISIAGRAKNGLYTYTERGSNLFSPDGPWPGPPVDATGAGVTVKSSFDPVNNQARVVIAECGWVITFVAYDIKERQNQSQIPGLALAINCGLNRFYDHDRVMATAPVRFGGNRYSDLVEYPLTIPEVLVLRGFGSLVSQNHPGASLQCSAVSNVLNQCSEAGKLRVGVACLWMLKHPRFIRCMDPLENVNSLLGLLQTCINYQCGEDVTCEDFVNSVVNTGCSTLPRVPELTYILKDDFCSP